MAACVNEQLLQQATYAPGPEGLDSVDDEPKSFAPFPTWDPDEPSQRKTPLSLLGKPMRVTLRRGDMLYLPAQWYVDFIFLSSTPWLAAPLAEAVNTVGCASPV
jgi:hypothetical protein